MSQKTMSHRSYPMMPRHRISHPHPHPRPAADQLPLNEAVKLEMANVPTKTPVAVLQEVLSRRGIAPEYQLVQIEGAIHEPIFRYRVTVDQHVAMGTGRSKKEAKHAAAKALLDTMIGNPPDDSQNGNGGQDDDKLLVPNPIGWLQELCMAHRWAPPLYYTESEEGLPHERTFTIACRVLKAREVGTGKSKKLAKREAARLMFKLLRDMPREAPSIGHVDEDEIIQKIGKISDRYSELKGSKIATLTTSHSHKVSQFHKTLKQSTGNKLTDLQTISLNDDKFNYVQFLQEIASEQQFEVTYVDIEEKSKSGKCQCLVQLSTLPVAVCYGTGATSKDAQSSAAHDALEYLKIMTKK